MCTNGEFSGLFDYNLKKKAKTNTNSLTSVETVNMKTLTCSDMAAVE